MLSTSWRARSIGISTTLTLLVTLLASIALPQSASAATAKSAAQLPGLASSSGTAPGLAAPAGNFSSRPPGIGEPMPATPTRTFDQSKATPVPSETTATKRVYQNPDGSKTALISDGTARVPDGKGGWTDIDLTLRAGTDGRYRPAVSATPVAIAAQGGTTLADVDTGQGDHLGERSPTGKRIGAGKLRCGPE